VDTAAGPERYTADWLIGWPGDWTRSCRTVIPPTRARQVDRMPDGLSARYGLGPQGRGPAAGAVYRVAGLGLPALGGQEAWILVLRGQGCPLCSLLALVLACDGRVDVVADAR